MANGMASGMRLVQKMSGGKRLAHVKGTLKTGMARRAQRRAQVGVETLAQRFESGLDLWTGEPLQCIIEKGE